MKLARHTALPSYIHCFALVANNRREEAEIVLREMLETSEQHYFKAYFIAMAYVTLGDYEKALKFMEKAFAERDTGCYGLAPNRNSIR